MRPPGPVTRTCMPPTESPKWSPIACTESRKASSPGLPSRLANRSAPLPSGEAWLKSGAEPVNSARVEYSPDGKGALLFASLDGNPGDEAFRDSVQAIGDHFGDSVGGMQVRVTGPGGLITDVYRIFLNADVKLLIGTV